MNPETESVLDQDTLPEAEHVGYVEACARKQLNLSAEEATAHVAKLAKGYVPAIRAAGRAGDLARVVELLGGAPLDASADAAAPKKAKK